MNLPFLMAAPAFSLPCMDGQDLSGFYLKQRQLTKVSSVLPIVHHKLGILEAGEKHFSSKSTYKYQTEAMTEQQSQSQAGGRGDANRHKWESASQKQS